MNLLLALVLTKTALAGTLYPHLTKGADGGEWCCSKNYSACERVCDRDTRCLLDCLKKHCLRDTNRCREEKPAEKIVSDDTTKNPAAPTPTPKMQLRQDGRLTGAGVITFEAENRGEEKSLTLQGIVFGKDRGGNVKVLKSTPTVEVIPSKPSVFTLRVLPKEFDDWAKLYGELTIAFTFPAEKDHNKWEFLNLLTQDDVAGQAPGQFKVKGAFEPK